MASLFVLKSLGDKLITFCTQNKKWHWNFKTLEYFLVQPYQNMQIKKVHILLVSVFSMQEGT